MIEDSLGTLWEAEDVTLGSPVTVRFLRETTFQAGPLPDYRTEGPSALSSRLTHPSMARILSSGRWQGTGWFLVMEPLRGETLAQRLRREGRLPFGEAVRIAVEVAGALEAAHAMGIVHGALHPESVFLRETFLADQDEVKVMDFALRTPLGNLVRSPAFPYLAPERVAGGEPTPASDVYAVAALTYRLMTGAVPGASPSQARGLQYEDLSRSYGMAEMPQSIVDVCLQALDPDPSVRPTARALTLALSQRLGASLAGPRWPDGSAPTQALPDEMARRRIRAEQAVETGRSRAAQAADRKSHAEEAREAARTRAALASKRRARAEQVVEAARSKRSVEAEETAAQRRAPTEEAAEAARRKAAEAALKRAGAEEARRRAEEARKLAAQAQFRAGQSYLRQRAAGVEMVGARPRTVPNGRRAVLLTASAAMIATALIAAALVFRPDTLGEQSPRGDLSGNLGQGVAGRTLIRVPRLVGLTAFEARRELLQRRLRLGAARPVRGTPGVVVRTSPPQGTPVSPGREIVVFVGAVPDRS
jgi:hypothetical protein